MEFWDNINANIRKASLNILDLLISFYPNEIKPIKNSIIKLLTISYNDKDDNIRNKSIYIYNKILKLYCSRSSIIDIKRKKKFNIFMILVMMIVLLKMNWRLIEILLKA